LHDKDDHQRRDHEREDQVAQQQARFRPQIVARSLFRLVYLDVFVVVHVNTTKRWRTAFSNSEHTHCKN
jgi:hypothetical protein